MSLHFFLFFLKIVMHSALQPTFPQLSMVGLGEMIKKTELLADLSNLQLSVKRGNREMCNTSHGWVGLRG